MLAALAGCRATTAASGGGDGRATAGRRVALTLFRDAALVTERWRVPLAGGRGSIDVPVDAQLAAGALSVIDTGGARLVGLALRAPGPAPGAHVAAGGTSGRLITMSGSRIAVEGGDRALHVTDSRGVVEYAGPAAAARASVTLEGTGTEAWIELSYPTPRIAWSAAYALIRDASGERATLEGAVAIDNKSGVLFPRAAVTVVDDTIASWRGRVAMDVSKALIGATTDAANATADRSLGVVDVERGETRLPLPTAPGPLVLREVLVFDPIGTKADFPNDTPQRARDYGLEARPSTTVLRSFEIKLGAKARRGLPAGPVRLFGRGQRGELLPLGAGRLFDRAQAKAKTATVTVGRSPEVTARRQRTELVIDEDAGHLVEEFKITVENAGARKARVLVREHLYRGTNWVIGYSSVPITDEENKLGTQQIQIPIDVPARGAATVHYRVMYRWKL